jgi:hypothetical protein
MFLVKRRPKFLVLLNFVHLGGIANYGNNTGKEADKHVEELTGKTWRSYFFIVM